MSVLTRPTRVDAGASESHAPAAASRRLDFLDGLRALACLLVVVDHLIGINWNHLQGHYPTGILKPLIYLEIFGQLAVGLFIVISGFCLMLPVVRREGALPGGARLFFWKRARRILPPYYAAVVLGVLVCGHPVSAWDIGSHLLLIQNLSTETILRINGAFWSIGVECQIYLWFPLFVWAWRRYGVARSLAVILPVAYLTCLRSSGTSWFAAMPVLYVLFTLGMLAAKISFSDRPDWRLLRDGLPWAGIAGSVGAAIPVAAVIWGFYGASCNIHYLYLMTGIVALCLLVAAARADGVRLRRVLEWRPLVAIGTFSYSIYLIHGNLIYPLGCYYRHYVAAPLHLSPGVSYFAMLACVIPIILAAAYLFYLAFERPFMNSNKKAVRG